MVNIDLNVEPEVAEDEAKESGSRKPRNPKWIIYETMVMLRGKYAVENYEPGAWRSRVPVVMENGVKARKKWPLVSAYCQAHGVRRAPGECRMRWQNLIVKFRQVSAWEAAVREEGGRGGAPAAESYWEMSNARRRERKLPGFCQREVYEFLGKMELARGDSDVDDHDDDGEEEVEEDSEHEKEDTETGTEHGNHNAGDVEKHGQQDRKKSMCEETCAGARLKRKANDPSRASGKI